MVELIHPIININFNKQNKLVTVTKNNSYINVEKPKHTEISANIARSGVNGVTFIPNVDSNGILSWSNTGNMENPNNVNLLISGSVITNTEILDIVQR